MLTPEEKMEKVELEMTYIRSVTNVLLDAIWYSEVSAEGDYVILLEQQKEHIRNITSLF